MHPAGPQVADRGAGEGSARAAFTGPTPEQPNSAVGKPTSGGAAHSRKPKCCTEYRW
jgi:hypothetical protein